ncbi:MAG: aquaporin, partial [Ligilactobacillus agilis]|nr:aquaporin [Ligilactobacillus agilis]
MLGEFLGTLTLIVLGCGVGAGLNLKQTTAYGQKNWFYV